MFVVTVNIWSNDGYDYITGEYTGARYATKQEAYRELEEAANKGLDVYIEEV